MLHIHVAYHGSVKESPKYRLVRASSQALWRMILALEDLHMVDFLGYTDDGPYSLVYKVSN